MPSPSSVRFPRSIPISTTDPVLARQALDAFASRGVPVAVLHREEELAGGDVSSDVDVVVGTSAAEALREVLPALSEAGLHPVVMWRYDVAGTRTVFLSTSDASEGLQLDLLDDPLGKGRYGVKSRALLSRSIPGRRWSRLDPIDERLYLLRKRAVKGQGDRVRMLAEGLREVGREPVRRAVEAMMAPRLWDEIDRLVEDPDQVGGAVRHQSRSAELARRLQRVREPAGAWTHLLGEGREELAREVEFRFARFLPHVGCSARPLSTIEGAVWFAREVAPIRWRPGLYVSWGGPISLPAPDVTVPEPRHDVLEAVVDALERRCLARVERELRPEPPGT